MCSIDHAKESDRLPVALQRITRHLQTVCSEVARDARRQPRSVKIERDRTVEALAFSTCPGDICCKIERDRSVFLCSLMASLLAVAGCAAAHLRLVYIWCTENAFCRLMVGNAVGDWLMPGRRADSCCLLACPAVYCDRWGVVVESSRDFLSGKTIDRRRGSAAPFRQWGNRARSRNAVYFIRSRITAARTRNVDPRARPSDRGGTVRRSSICHSALERRANRSTRSRVGRRRVISQSSSFCPLPFA